jgi:hypothetical protein
MSENSAPSPGKISIPCTRCGSDGFRAIPARTDAGDGEWFHCPACGHMWPRPRTGSQPPAPPLPGDVAAR